MASVIPANQVVSTFTTLITDRYDEMLKARPTSFLRSFFQEIETEVRYPSLDIRRGDELVAVDVIRGHQGERTQLTKATQKVFDPFYYNLYFDATELQEYWRMFASTSVSTNVMTEAVNGVAIQNQINQDMIDRAIEVHAAELFTLGTCTSLRDGSVINYKRKSGSFPDAGAGNYWANSGIDPYAQLQADCEFIRWNGKYMGGQFNTIMGATAFSDLMNNDVVKARNDIKMWKLDDLNAPKQIGTEGSTYHGTISCGPYIVHIWQYPQFYKNSSGVQTSYLDAKKVITLPKDTAGLYDLMFGATPQLVAPGAPTLSLVKGKYIMSDYLDPKKKSHEFHIESAPILAPKAIDTMVTRRVVAA